MTPQQKTLLDYIEGFLTSHGFAPSYAEMQLALDLASKSSVARLVRALVAQGLLVVRTGRVRGIELPGPDLRPIPTSALWAELERRGAVRV